MNMRVKTWVETAQEVEVTVSIADVMSSIAELANDDRLPMTLDCINSIYAVLREIPDASIADMTEQQRRLIGDGLAVQAERYVTPNVEGNRPCAALCARSG